MVFSSTCDQGGDEIEENQHGDGDKTAGDRTAAFGFLADSLRKVGPDPHRPGLIRIEQPTRREP
jgi:hypothetical protein